MTVATLQLVTSDSDDTETRLNGIARAMGQALAKTRVDLFVLPMMSQALDAAKGERVGGPFVASLGELALKHNAHLIVGILEAEKAALYRSAVLVSPRGKILGVQRQVHTVGTEKTHLARSEGVTTFVTDLGSIGLMVATDLDYPEVARIHALQGGEILAVVLNQAVRSERHSHLLYFLAACRAWENRCFVVACNAASSSPDEGLKGGSCILDQNGQPIARSETRHQDVIFAALQRDKFYEGRADSPYFRDRRPENYGLVSESNS